MIQRTAFILILSSIAIMSGCSGRSAYSHKVFPKLVDAAPYESDNSEKWNGYFRSKKTSLYPETLKEILRRALVGIDEPDAVVTKLESMGMYTHAKLDSDNSGYKPRSTAPPPPYVFFILSLDHFAGFFLERDLTGYIRLGDVDSEDRIVVENSWTSL